MITVSIIIPAYNEEKTISVVLSKVKKVTLPKKIKREIVVVNDSSEDSTFAILKKAKGIKVITHNRNKGKGAAVKTGLKHSKGEIIIIQDADLEYDPKYISKLLLPILSGKADVVYGTRLKNYPLRLTGAKKTPLITHYLGNKFLSLITSILFGVKVTDMETGYKVFTKEVIKGLNFKSNTFDFEPEFTAKILKKGYKIFEIPILTSPRGYDEGKKITWRDGFRAIWTLFKYKFVD